LALGNGGVRILAAAPLYPQAETARTLFGLFFAASRGNTILRVLFFWIPTLVVSALGFAFLGLLTYVVAISRHQ
jgi:hypothetical protein